MRPVLTRLWAMRRAVLFYAILLALGWLIGYQVQRLTIPEIRPLNEPMIHRIVTTALLVYVLTAAIPFVPGAEIGFLLLLFFGARAAPIVYIGMVGALLLSYSVARLVPPRMLSRTLTGLGLGRAGALVEELAACDADSRWRLIEERVHSPLARRVLHNRYLLLVVLLNLPGNSLIGGGGGLAFAAGLSRTIAFWPFVAVVLIAVLPVPLIFLLLPFVP